MEEMKEKKNVHPLLEFLGDEVSVAVRDEKQSQSLLDFLQMVDEGYVLNSWEIACLRKIDYWWVVAADKLPESICELKNLTALDVFYTQISELPERLMELKNLTSLDVSGTQISELPERLVELKNLTSLKVSRTQISELPERLAELKNLTCLDVSGTQISELPEKLVELKKLTSLKAFNTQISELPEKISKLNDLEYLDISNTKIETNELSHIIKLKKIKKIGLRGLTLHHIPQELIQLNISFDFKEVGYMFDNGIYLKNTILTTQPISLFIQPRKLIEAYYAEEKVLVSEAKVIFLGYGDAGKTYTIKRILKDGLKGEYETEPTPGIDIQHQTVRYNDKKLDIHFWDFGGQEIMHAMHRCFLTGRTCYVVVIDNRKQNMTEQAEYWLRNINSFAPNCPVILAVNRIDGSPDSGINEPKLKEMFKNNLIGDPIYYSAKTSTEEEFQRLTDAIYKQASQLDSYGMEFPVSWAAIRTEIETYSKEHYYLDNQYYHAICEKHGLESVDIRKWLLEWFNDLGVCFSYHLDADKEELKHYQILNPEWLTNAIYIIINTCQGLSEHGVILHTWIDKQLNDISIEKKKRVFEKFVHYSETERNYILQIMRKFQLSYQVTENKEFIPALCKNETPLELHPPVFQAHLSYEMEYEYLPDTVIHRLMILCCKKLNLQKTWKEGLCIEVELDSITAVVEMKNATILRIDVYTIQGSAKPWKVLSYLRGHILSINRDLGLSAIDAVIVKDGNREGRIEVDVLLNAKEEGYPFYPVADQNRKPFKINIGEILGEVFGQMVLNEAFHQVQENNVSFAEAFRIVIDRLDKLTDVEREHLELDRQSLETNRNIADNTAKAAEQMEQIHGDTQKISNQMETVIDNQEQMREQLKLANSLIATLSIHQDAKVKQLAAEMQQALNQKKSPWEKFREYLGDGANLLTIISSIAPFINSLLQVPEIQMLPEQILTAMRTMGAL